MWVDVQTIRKQISNPVRFGYGARIHPCGNKFGRIWKKENRLNFIGGRDVRTIIKLMTPLAFGFHLLYNQRQPDLVHMSGNSAIAPFFTVRCTDLEGMF